MDVKFLGFTIILFFLTACNNKTVGQVFSESQQKPAPECSAERVETRFIVEWESGHLSLESAHSTDTFIENFLTPNLELIKHVEYDKVVRLKDIQVNSVFRPSSPTVDDWGQVKVSAPEAWASGYRGAGVLVGVVDAPIDYSHPQIAPQLAENLKELTGVTGVDDDGNGLVDDTQGWDFSNSLPKPIIDKPENQEHGSHVTGVIVAHHKSGAVKGIAPEAKIIPAAFLKCDTCGGSLMDAIAAIKYSASRGARIINASWGGGFCSKSLRDTLVAIGKKEILIVVASGNENADLDRTPSYPAKLNLDNQVTVAATNQFDKITSFSNTSYSLVHMGAPGELIWSTVPNGYAQMDGTSMAAPFVTGAAAVLMGARPDASIQMIKQALLNGVDSDPNWGYRVLTRGRLNIKKSLDYLLNH